jgi:hypothetical protein
MILVYYFMFLSAIAIGEAIATIQDISDLKKELKKC